MHRVSRVHRCWKTPNISTSVVFLTLSFVYYSPIKPQLMDWCTLYPRYFPSGNQQSQEPQKHVEFADIGCGYGGLLGN